MKFQFDVIGEDAAAADLLDVGGRGGDPRPAMRQIRDMLAETVEEQFRSQGSHLGTPWPANKPGTLANKARRGQGTRVLRATGALEASLTGGKGRRTLATRTTARAGTSVWYGIFAQAGTKRVPARPIVGADRADRTKALRILEHFVVHGRVLRA